MAARARISRAKGRVEDDGLPPKMVVSLTNPHLHHHHHQLLCAQSSGEPRAATEVGPSARAEKKGSWRNGAGAIPQTFAQTPGEEGKSATVSVENV